MANKKRRKTRKVRKIKKLSLPKGKSRIIRSKGVAPAIKSGYSSSITSTRQPSKSPAYGGNKKGSGGNLVVRKRKY